MKNKTNVIKSATYLTLFVSLLIFILSFIQIRDTFNVEQMNITIISLFIQRFLGFVMLLMITSLRKRRFFAWLITVISLSTSIILTIIHLNILYIFLLLIQIYCLIVFVVNHKAFVRETSKPSIKLAFLFMVLIMGFLFINALLSVTHLNSQLTLAQSIDRLTDYLFIYGGASRFGRFVFYFFWFIFGVCLLLLVRPMYYDIFITPQHKERALEILRRDGQNPSSYLTIEGDKSLYFSDNVDGYVAYGLVGKSCIAYGDPVCSEEDIIPLSVEFMNYAKSNGYDLIFLGVTSKYLDKYKEIGLQQLKYGEDAMIDLETFDLVGNKIAKLRADVNHATKAGVSVYEYKPLEGRDTTIEEAFTKITNEWLQDKKSSQLKFTVGDVNLDDPLDRRYFYAKDESGNIIGFHVFLPFDSKNGWLADVTRRLRDAPSGTTMKINVEAFLKFKEEGYKWASLGDSPLANVRDEANSNHMYEKMMEAIYKNVNQFYDFKGLHRAKEKYNPLWMPSYIVYVKNNLNFDMILSIVKIQNANGASDYLKTYLADTFRKGEKNAK